MPTSLPGDHRVLEPPDSIPNSEVKRYIADGSVGFPHVRVGHRQALNKNALIGNGQGVLPCAMYATETGGALRSYPGSGAGSRQALIPNPAARCVMGFFYAS